MSRVQVDSVRPATRPDRAPGEGMAILIEVPVVKPPRIRSAATTPGQGGLRRPPARRPRRRLRREVRLAGWVLLALAPMGSAGALDWAKRADPVADRPAGNPVVRTDNPRAVAVRLEPGRPAGKPWAGALDTASVVVLSIEPAVVAPAADAEVPVVFPGYVLPDDRLEEPAHEGS